MSDVRQGPKAEYARDDARITRTRQRVRRRRWFGWRIWRGESRMTEWYVGPLHFSSRRGLSSIRFQQFNRWWRPLALGFSVVEWGPLRPDSGRIAQHRVADAFWESWRENGETHRHGYYESTWMAIRAALRAAVRREHGE